MNAIFSSHTAIQDLRNHPAEVVLTLRRLLAGGAKVTPDPKRLGFYEVESNGVVYYIYESTPSGKILLLATWPAEEVLDEALQTA
ncbi:MAG TPA: hypothetical protein VMU43_04410 [Candidatus Acidoferrum sp.]|nr:hypothetical protein [Candidatus Acidoferrum sp.]